ncbi:MAG: glycosyltransferase [Candidatus Peribacteraceae bacterium]|nr:glycosyltransferase [Candidatus Peribacteraceae bacterium]
MSDRSVSIVIPAHNEEKWVQRCVASIRAAAQPPSLQIIVADNASTDRTAETARAAGATLVVHEPRKGTNFARQRGWKEAHGDIVAFIDADEEMPPHWFTAVLEAFARHPDAVAVTGPCRCDDLPPWKRWQIRLWNTSARVSHMFTGASLMGGNFAVRRTALEKAGGFDTSLVFFGDDVDTARRLRKHGKILYLPSLCIRTSGRRWAAQGFVHTASAYGLNYLSAFLLGRPVIRRSRDIR